MMKKRTTRTMVTAGFMAASIAVTACMAGCSVQEAGDTEKQEQAQAQVQETESADTSAELEDVTVILDEKAAAQIDLQTHLFVAGN